MRVASLKTGGKAGHQSLIEPAGHRSRAARSAAVPAAVPDYVDGSSRGVLLNSLVQMMQSSPQVTAQLAFNAHLAAGSAGVAQRVEGNEEELLQGKFAPVQRTGVEDEEPLQGKFAPTQLAAAESASASSPNQTGLPDNLKSGIESLSGISLDRVRVHYNSPQPAQLNAHAYAQGTEIHLGPGQEQHLPHEAWHVVQQTQGRVRPTLQMRGGVPVNDDPGLEQEADIMGARALGAAPGKIGEPAQLRACPFDHAVAQLQSYDVGNPGAHTRADILGLPATDILSFYERSHPFSHDYSNSVLRAQYWRQTTVEGTAGFTALEFSPPAFDAIASAAEVSSNNLVGPLDNNKNKTLIVVRAFRGPINGSMAGQTENDLVAVLGACNAQAGALAAAGLISDPTATVAMVEADPAEAHPNTLPTAKISFDDGSTVYFKGRSQAAEDALVGNGLSAAHSISSLQAADPNGPQGVGKHGFVNVPGLANPAQIAGDVGAEQSQLSMFGNFLDSLPTWIRSDSHPRPEAIAAWLSAAKTALLVCLTATTDLHASNIKAGQSGKSHLIDGEFLLDVTQWQAYHDMANGLPIVNFNIADFVPPWLRTHMATLSAANKNAIANVVLAQFNALQADTLAIQNQILGPINALIAGPALLRVMPVSTDDWLRSVTEFHNLAGAGPGTAQLIDRVWQMIVNDLVASVTVTNPHVGKPEIRANLAQGMVPLFHVRSSDSKLLLNKQFDIGDLVAGRSVAQLLAKTKAAITNRYADMCAMVHAAITA